MTVRMLLAALLLLSLSFNAQSQYWEGPVEIRLSPAEPIAGNSIEAVLPINGCYFGGPNYMPERTVVTKNDRTITIDVYVRQFITCFSAGDPLLTWTVPISLGTLLAGSYTVTARYFPTDFFPTPPPFQALTTTFMVADNTPVSLPLGGPAGMIVLAGILLISGIRMLANSEAAFALSS